MTLQSSFSRCTQSPLRDGEEARQEELHPDRRLVEMFSRSGKDNVFELAEPTVQWDIHISHNALCVVRRTLVGEGFLAKKCGGVEDLKNGESCSRQRSEAISHWMGSRLNAQTLQ